MKLTEKGLRGIARFGNDRRHFFSRSLCSYLMCSGSGHQSGNLGISQGKATVLSVPSSSAGRRTVPRFYVSTTPSCTLIPSRHRPRYRSPDHFLETKSLPFDSKPIPDRQQIVTHHTTPTTPEIAVGEQREREGEAEPQLDPLRAAE